MKKTFVCCTAWFLVPLESPPVHAQVIVQQLKNGRFRTTLSPAVIHIHIHTLPYCVSVTAVWSIIKKYEISSNLHPLNVSVTTH